jgi:NADH:ubiquinone oxidoreductase subunit F (NADH-binding)
MSHMLWEYEGNSCGMCAPCRHILTRVFDAPRVLTDALRACTCVVMASSRTLCMSYCCYH